jgi:hypothetical protein
VIRTIIEVSGQTSIKPFPKSAAGREAVLHDPEEGDDPDDDDGPTGAPTSNR